MSENPLQIGKIASIDHEFTDRDVRAFADVSRDTNPIHLDDAAAAASLFGRRVVHGMLVASLFSGLLGVEMPGEGTIYLGQTLSFKAPVFIGDR
ncbi:MAG: MaoC family dehydratase, partial [Xanthomonadales bacterium]|nr:MaoC family dehydratase [Xanthomonadales bacterium]